MRESRCQLDKGLEVARTGNTNVTNKYYKKTGLAECAANGKAWNQVYAPHRDNETIRNDALFDFAKVRTAAWSAQALHAARAS